MEAIAATGREISGRKLFVSHSSADAATVQWVAAQARALGVSPYLAEEDPRPGTHVANKVREQIDDCDAVLALLTRSGIASNYVQQEIGAAHQAGKPILAFVELGADVGDLAMLTGVEYLVFDPENLTDSSAHVTRALVHLGAGSGQQAPPRLVVATEPLFQLHLSADLQLTAGELFLGVFVFSAVLGLVYLAAKSEGVGLKA